jgi:hypothetical protein
MPIDYIAGVLDPHTKHLAFLRNDTEKQFVYLAVDRLMENVAVAERASTNQDSFPEGLRLLGMLDSPEKTPQTRSGTVRTLARKNLYSSELTSYLAEPKASFLLPTLTWWKSSEVKYPCLSALAKIYLAIPASSATVERLFSRASIVRPLSAFSPSNLSPYFAGGLSLLYIFPSGIPFALVLLMLIR